jgi:hypothetical protein
MVHIERPAATGGFTYVHTHMQSQWTPPTDEECMYTHKVALYKQIRDQNLKVSLALYTQFKTQAHVTQTHDQNLTFFFICSHNGHLRQIKDVCTHTK